MSDMQNASTQDGAEPEIAGTWELAKDALADEFPDRKEGILFCIWKLRQDKRATLSDFRDEAKLRGVSLGGRSLHSAKVALGWEEPSRRRTKAEIEATRGGADEVAAPVVRAPAPASSTIGEDLESQLLANVQRIRSAAQGEALRLKEAIREAIRVLQAAVDEGGD